MRTALCAATAAMSLSFMSGCLVSSGSRNSMSGTYIGRETASQIEPGVTTAEWIQAVLGTPTSHSTLSDGSEILKWSYSRTTASRGSVFLLFGSRSVNEVRGNTYVQIRDGIVERAWQD